MKNKTSRACPVERAGHLDSRFRRWFQNPQKILRPYIEEGMSVLDVGCGPGFFTIDMAWDAGFTVEKGPGVILSKTAILKKKE